MDLSSDTLPSIHTPPQPRRAFSMPPLSHLSILPLAHSPSHEYRSFRSTSRRISYNMKSRAGRHAMPLTIGGLLATIIFLMTWSRSPRYSVSLSRAAQPHLYTRHHQHPDTDTDDASIPTKGEPELIAEDDLYFQAYQEPDTPGPEEIKAQKEIEEHRRDVLKLDKEHSIRALTWWLAEGGVFPHEWEMPTKSQLTKAGASGFEKMLDHIDSGETGETIFEEGWVDFAKKQYRMVVFSKTYCPYSKKAKAILDKYRLTPAPFIVELDKRSDAETLQNLLKYLTGRRTVPNILLDFVSLGGADDLTLLHAEGGLQRQLEAAELVPGPRRRRGLKGKKAGKSPEDALKPEVIAPPEQAAAPGVEGIPKQDVQGMTDEAAVMRAPHAEDYQRLLAPAGRAEGEVETERGVAAVYGLAANEGGPVPDVAVELAQSPEAAGESIAHPDTITAQSEERNPSSRAAPEVSSTASEDLLNELAKLRAKLSELETLATGAVEHLVTGDVARGPEVESSRETEPTLTSVEMATIPILDAQAFIAEPTAENDELPALEEKRDPTPEPEGALHERSDTETLAGFNPIPQHDTVQAEFEHAETDSEKTRQAKANVVKAGRKVVNKDRKVPELQPKFVIAPNPRRVEKNGAAAVAAAAKLPRRGARGRDR